MSEDKKLSRRRSYHKHKDAINARQRAKRKADPSVLEKERARDAEIMYGKDFKQYIVRRKMKRCVDENVEWGLGNLEDSIAYLDWPEVCPVLGIKLNYTGRRDTNDPDTPSLDRRDNSKGYVRGNVRVISWRANSRKSDLTALELWQIYRYAKDGRGLFSKSPPKPEPMQWTEATPEVGRNHRQDGRAWNRLTADGAHARARMGLQGKSRMVRGACSQIPAPMIFYTLRFTLLGLSWPVSYTARRASL